MTVQGTGGDTGSAAPALLCVSPASLGSSDAGSYGVCPASVRRVKMMLGLSLGLSSELFAELGWVSPGALSSCPSAIKIPGWGRGGSCRSRCGRQPGAPSSCWSRRSGEGRCGTAAMPALPGAVPLLVPKLVFTLSMESKWTKTPGCELHHFQKGGSAWSLSFRGLEDALWRAGGGESQA